MLEVKYTVKADKRRNVPAGAWFLKHFCFGVGRDIPAFIVAMDAFRRMLSKQFLLPRLHGKSIRPTGYRKAGIFNISIRIFFYDKAA